MSLPNEVTSLLAGGAKKYEITRSLRFNSADSAYLNRTFGAGGNRKTYTFSFWVKRSTISTDQVFFTASSSSTDDARFKFNSGNTISLTYHRTGSSDTAGKTTTRVFRDTSSWYHIVVAVDTTQATATNRCRLYVNGTEETSFTGVVDVAQNTDTAFNTSGNSHQIGGSTVRGWYLGGYMTEINFVDGQALTPSSFGETDPVTGVWIPKRYTGTYGTNGFYLSFANNASTTTLGYDDGTGIAGSGAGSNDWTLNNFSVAAGVGNDSLEDTPTNNFCTWNPLIAQTTSSSSLTNGNLEQNTTLTGTEVYALANMAIPQSGQWYAEISIVAASGVQTTTTEVGLVSGDRGHNGGRLDQCPSSTVYRADGQKGIDASFSAYGASWGNGNTIGIAVDKDSATVEFFKDGASQGTISSLDVADVFLGVCLRLLGGTGYAYLNAGQRPFAYTPPSGYKALNTANLPTPTILKPSQYMNIVTWTGTGATRSITGVGFQPDLVWSKSRSNAETHKLVDSTRGATKALSSATTGDEVTESGIASFDSDGFTIDGATDTGYNTNTYTYVGWNWKKGVTPGFDIVTYTGNGSNRTISHSLGAVPHFMIVKARTTASTDQGWAVYHRNLTSAVYYLVLNTTAAEASGATVWNSTAPTTSEFSVGTSALTNTNNDTYLAYLWTEITGFSRFGTYTGNGSADGPFVWCGFRPRLVLIKEASSTGSWGMLDSARSPVNPINNQNLWADLANATGAAAAYLDILSNGFKIRDTDSDKNTSSQTYIFAAFAECPFKYSLAR